MPESLVQVTSGAGPKLHTWQRTIGANSVEDEFVIPGEYPLPSYSVLVHGLTNNTADAHLMQIMSGASTLARIRRISVDQSANATAPALIALQVWRLSTAGTGGTVITPRPYDTADSAASTTAMTLPTVKGTESVQVLLGNLVLRQSLSATSANVDDAWVWTQHPGTKPLIIPAGTTNGIAIKATAGFGAAGSANILIEFVETTFAG
jgi:hypothetical protein